MSFRRSVPYLLMASVAAIPRMLTAWRFVFVDEAHWMSRSQGFSDALMNLDPGGLTASREGTATMPGILTMWVGSAARAALWFADKVGVLDASGPFNRNWSGLGLAQLIAAVLNAALIVVLFHVLRRWVGDVAAWVACLILATEPWIIGLGAMLHVDSLSTLPATIGVLGFAWALGVPDPERRPDRPVLTAGVAGVFLAMGVLTKISAVSYLAFAPLVVAMAYLRIRRHNDPAGDDLRDLRRSVIAFALAGLATIPIAYPAIWADPAGQIEVLRGSAGLASRGHPQFWYGELTQTVGPAFYFVTVPFRMTAWFSMAVLVTVPLALWHRDTRLAAAMVLAGIAPTFLILSFSSKQIDRYGITVIVALAVVVGLGVSALVDRLGHGPRFRIAGRVAGTVLLLHAVNFAPHSLAFYNPLMGGGAAAVEATTIVGGGLGMDVAGERIMALEGGDCLGVETSFGGRHDEFHFPCLMLAPDAEPEYMLVYVSDRQRWPERQQELIDAAELVDVVIIGGIEFVRIYRF